MRYRYDEIGMVAKGIYYHSESKEDFLNKLYQLFDKEFDFGLAVLNFIQKDLPYLNDEINEAMDIIWAYHRPCEKCGMLGKFYKNPNEIGLLRDCPDCIKTTP